jgi:hypothetical protein
MTKKTMFGYGMMRCTPISLALSLFLVLLFPNPVRADGVTVRPNFAQAKIMVLTQDGANLALQVELARSDEEISYGLMFLSDLPSTDGMLFLLPGYEVQSFWMKNTVMPLDIIFLDEKGAVLNVYAHTTPLSTEHLYSAGPTKMVLEVKAGMAAKWGIGSGAVVTPPPNFITP